VNPGGEPERDESGLPPVDIEVPDDARELDRDVQAYRRELRALRRIARRGRWHGSLSKDGVVLPLLACCLILALITGTLLTVFTATSNQSLGLPGTPSSPTTQTAAHLVPLRALPDSRIGVGGQSSMPVSALRNAVLVLVPPGCDSCAGTLNWLAGVAAGSSAKVFLIYTAGTSAEVHRLDSQVRGSVLLAEDIGSALSTAEVKAGIPAGELTAILIAPDRLATWATHLSIRDNPTALIQALSGASA